MLSSSYGWAQAYEFRVYAAVTSAPPATRRSRPARPPRRSTPTPTPTITKTATPTPTPTVTMTIAPTPTPTPTATDPASTSPGLVMTVADISFVKSKIAAKAEP